MLIYYTDGQEVIVTTPENEDKVVFEFFDPTQATGRDIDDYDREVVEDICVSFNVGIRKG